MNVEYVFSDFLDISIADDYQLSQLMDAWTQDGDEGDYGDFFSLSVEG